MITSHLIPTNFMISKSFPKLSQLMVSQPIISQAQAQHEGKQDEFHAMFDGETPGDLVGSTALVGRIDEGEDVGEDLGGASMGFPLADHRRYPRRYPNTWFNPGVHLNTY